jgi:alanyl-tRNA synthetase
MGDLSVELCGGTHVANTSDISVIKILSETGIASGVRRIEAITGKAVFEYYAKIEEELNNVAKLLKAEPSMIEKRIKSLQEEIKSLNSENAKLKNKLAKDAMGDIMDNVVEVKGVKVLATKLPDVDMNELRNLGDQLKDKIGEGIIVLASNMGSDKVSLIVTGTDAAIKAGFHAGNVIKQAAAVVGGGGGGRPNMAQAGGKNVAGIPDALSKSLEIIKEQIA